MENKVVWQSQEIEKIKRSYTSFEKAFNEGIDRIENTFGIVLKEGDVKMFFENRKCLSPFRQSLANYIWNYGSSRIGTSQEQIEERVKEVLAPFVRATCSLYWTSPDYVEFADCRLHVKWDELNAYLMELYSVSLNTETRQQVWELAQKACKVLNELEKLSVENSGTDWFKVHATQAYVNGGRAIIGFVDGRYQPLAEELTNVI